MVYSCHICHNCHNCHNSLVEFVISAFGSINVWENSAKLDMGIYYILCELFTNIDPIYSSHNSYNSHNSHNCHNGKYPFS